MAGFTKLISGLVEKGQKWVGAPDENIISGSDGHCSLCYQGFGMTMGKYKCYLCGVNSCESCCANQYESSERIGILQRICDDCVCICQPYTSPGLNNRGHNHKPVWKKLFGDSSNNFQAYLIELCFTLISVQKLPGYLFRECPIHKDEPLIISRIKSAENGILDATCTCSRANDTKHIYAIFYCGQREVYKSKSVAAHSSAPEWKNELFSASFDVRNPTSNFVTVELYASNLASLSSGNLGSISPSTSSSSGSSNREIRELIGRCRIPVLDLWVGLDSTQESPLVGCRPITRRYFLQGRKIPYFASLSGSSCSITVNVARLNQGDLVVQGNLPLFQTIIPGAMAWKHFDLMSQKNGEKRVSLLSLFPPNSLWYTHLFLPKLLGGYSRFNEKRSELCTYCLRSQASANLAKSRIMDGLRNVFGDCTQSGCTCGYLKPDSVLPTSEYILQATGKVHFSYGSNSSGELIAVADGVLLLTTHRLLFIPSSCGPAVAHYKLFRLSLCEIESVIVRSKWRDRHSILEVSSLMDGIIYRFALERPSTALPSKPRVDELVQPLQMQILRSIRDEICWRKDEDMFSLDLAASCEVDDSTFRSSANELLQDYERLGIIGSSTSSSLYPSLSWRISDINSTFGLCHSYPMYLAMPCEAEDEQLIASAGYRSSRRLPTLSWLHPTNGAALLRSSQPMVGLMDTPCTADDKLLLCVRDAARRHRVELGSGLDDLPIMLRIVDARPLLSAQGNAIMGKGFENITRLGGASSASIEFLGIENIHAVRASYASMRMACCRNDSGFLLTLHESKWLQYLSDLLRGAIYIALQVEGGHPCLVHCSDGWDRTAQLVSLAQILLDPFYRTIKGFKSLINKDFIHFGHQFRYRSGLGASGIMKEDSSNCSPIFLQFLDAVWQIWHQEPWEFEFSDRLLVAIAELHKSGFVGDFKFNSIHDRFSYLENRKASSQSSGSNASLWHVLDSYLPEFQNVCYKYQPFAASPHALTPPEAPLPEPDGARHTVDTDDCHVGPSTGASTSRLGNLSDWLQEPSNRFSATRQVDETTASDPADDVNGGKTGLPSGSTATPAPSEDVHNCTKLILPQTSISHLKLWEAVHFKGLPLAQTGQVSTSAKEKILESLLKSEESRNKSLLLKIEALKEQLKASQAEAMSARKNESRLRDAVNKLVLKKSISQDTFLRKSFGDETATDVTSLDADDWELLTLNKP